MNHTPYLTTAEIHAIEFDVTICTYHRRHDAEVRCSVLTKLGLPYTVVEKHADSRPLHCWAIQYQATATEIPHATRSK